jgi:hypothetical protein
MEKPTEDEISLMVQIIRNHYPFNFTNEIIDLIQLIYLEFKVELGPEDVRKYCLVGVEQEETNLIMKTWNI